MTVISSVTFIESVYLVWQTVEKFKVTQYTKFLKKERKKMKIEKRKRKTDK